MNIQRFLSSARAAMSARRVYGKPFAADGVTIIPAASIAGGAGGGDDTSGNGGGGFGLHASPKGAWVIRDGEVSWKPAVDVNRIVVGGQVVALVAVLAARSVAKVYLESGGGRKRRRRGRRAG